MSRENLKISGMFVVGIIVIVSFVYAVNVQPTVFGDLNTDFFKRIDPDSYSYDLRDFFSYEEFSDFLKNSSSVGTYNYYAGGDGFRGAPVKLMVSDVSSESFEVYDVDFSETNIQVEGVDEPDKVKTDGTFLYIVSGNTVYIVRAWPVEDAKVLSKLSFDFNVKNIFINGDRLVVFGETYNYYYNRPILEDSSIICPDPWFSSSSTYIKVYDIVDRENPELKNDIIIGGSYYNARMIGDHVYVITTQSSYDVRRWYEDDDPIIPLISVNGELKKIPLNDLCIVDVPSTYTTLTHVASVNVKDDSEEVVDKIFTLGNSQTMYVSKNNIYITYEISRNDYHIMQQIIDEVVFPILPDSIKEDILNARGFGIDDYQKGQVVDWILDSFYNTLDPEQSTEIQSEIQKRIHRTMIHKISVIDGSIEYMCNGSVPGRLLNQFSMDEHNGFFRVATQTNGWWRTNVQQATNVYILDGSLNIVGKVEDIAPDENLHSSRFMGDRAYLVTFKKIDPFFTLDLSDPYNPKILGILKIPGYSDYLHPYDEDHIIGVGKDTDDQGSFAWYQGLKIALFDVSDFENPKEVSKIIIGDRGTDSIALRNHKAFLFDREKELLVLPVQLHEIDEAIKEQNNGDTGWQWGEFTYQGAFVYQLSKDDGFEYKGRITHREDYFDCDDPYNDCYYSYSSSYNIERSLYIEDVLFTISNGMVKMNSLSDLSELNSIELE